WWKHLNLLSGVVGKPTILKMEKIKVIALKSFEYGGEIKTIKSEPFSVHKLEYVFFASSGMVEKYSKDKDSGNSENQETQEESENQETQEESENQEESEAPETKETQDLKVK